MPALNRARLNHPVAYAIAWRWEFGKRGWASSMPSSDNVLSTLRYMEQFDSVNDLAGYNRINALYNLKSIKADMTRINNNYQEEADYVDEITQGKFSERVAKVCQFYGINHPLNGYLNKGE